MQSMMGSDPTERGKGQKFASSSPNFAKYRYTTMVLLIQMNAKFLIKWIEFCSFFMKFVVISIIFRCAKAKRFFSRRKMWQIAHCFETTSSNSIFTAHG